MRAHGAHRVAVADERVMVGLIDHSLAFPGAGRFRAGAVAESRDAVNFVEREVLVETVVVVASDLDAVAVEHGARHAAKSVPNGRALAVRRGGALDLRGGGGDAPNETGGKRNGRHVSGKRVGQYAARRSSR